MQYRTFGEKCNENSKCWIDETCNEPHRPDRSATEGMNRASDGQIGVR